MDAGAVLVLRNGIRERLIGDLELLVLREAAGRVTLLDELASLEIEPDDAEGDHPSPQRLRIELRAGFRLHGKRRRPAHLQAYSLDAY